MKTSSIFRNSRRLTCSSGDGGSQSSSFWSKASGQLFPPERCQGCLRLSRYLSQNDLYLFIETHRRAWVLRHLSPEGTFLIPIDYARGPTGDQNLGPNATRFGARAAKRAVRSGSPALPGVPQGRTKSNEPVHKRWTEAPRDKRRAGAEPLLRHNEAVQRNSPQLRGASAQPLRRWMLEIPGPVAEIGRRTDRKIQELIRWSACPKPGRPRGSFDPVCAIF